MLGKRGKATMRECGSKALIRFPVNTRRAVEIVGLWQIIFSAQEVLDKETISQLFGRNIPAYSHNWVVLVSRESCWLGDFIVLIVLWHFRARHHAFTILRRSQSRMFEMLFKERLYRK